MNEAGTVVQLKPESILVYTPAERMSDRQYVETYDVLQAAACRAMACLPVSLPVGIIILKPGDKLEMLSRSKTLGEIAEERAKCDNATTEIAGSEE